MWNTFRNVFIRVCKLLCKLKQWVFRGTDPLLLLLLSFLRLSFGLLLRLFPGFLLLFEFLYSRVAVVGRVCITSHTFTQTLTARSCSSCLTPDLPTSVRILFISSFFLWAREARFCFSIHLLSSRLIAQSHTNTTNTKRKQCYINRIEKQL